MFAKLINYAKFLRRMSGVMKLMNDVDGASNILVPDEGEATIDRQKDKTAFIFEGYTQSFGQFEGRANQIAHWALSHDFKPGDTVALVMENCPDYVAIWFGLSKVGVVTALINSNLEGAGLVHCINIVAAKAVIASGAQAANVKAIQADLDGLPPLWDMNGQSGAHFSDAIQACSKQRPSREHRQALNGDSSCIYIYTSGTTGLPKAARINHARLRRTMRMSIALANITPGDIVYNVLPLYHITGGGLGVGATLFAGAASHIRRKFSASAFWDDVVESGATAFVYIGELCRYLINSDPHPRERDHNLRLGFGNGMRGDVWEAFVDRFKVDSMRELYGSTEGNVTFINLDGTIGAVGQAPPFLDRRLGIAFVKFDIEAEQPMRDKDGFCIKCETDEVGEVLGMIAEGRQSFEGYQDEAATAKKILTDVFEKGDKWFRTGDLMSRDRLGYVHFVDRIGDTFRWKGENVATNEVSDILSKFEGVALANVYGVEVPGAEGRAGMASITIDREIDFTALAQHLSANLPPYAIPLFVRVKQEADTTGTFKFRKVDAVKEGFDITTIDDPIWVLNGKAGTYDRLTPEQHAEICSGTVRL